jgi:hypothetical protein
MLYLYDKEVKVAGDKTERNYKKSVSSSVDICLSKNYRKSSTTQWEMLRPSFRPELMGGKGGAPKILTI